MESQINNTDYDPSARYGVPILLRTLDTAGASLNDVIKFNGTRWVAGPGGSSAWSAITGNPTEVAYFDALGFGTSDADFTTTGTTFNLSRTPTSGNTLKAYFGDNTLGFGLTGGLFVNQTNDGLNGVIIADATPFGNVQNQSFYGFFNPAANQNANMKAQYNSGTDEANLGWDATDSTGVGSHMQLNSRSTGTSAGFTVYGPNNSGSNSVFAVRDAGNNRLLFLDNDGNFQINNSWYLPNVDGLNGQVLHTNGAGQSYWGTPSATASLTQNYIGFGDGSNVLTGDASYQYDFANLNVIQTIPDNTGNAGITTSPLSFGAASFIGSGLNDLTLYWSSADYKSNKYGGNLTIQIDSTGTPDTFSWHYTGGYSQIIGSGTGVAITGSAQLLSDNQGRRIGEITFGSTTGHTNGDTWSAGTSLSTYTWGQKVSDGSHTFIYTQPVYGQYYIGDGQYLTDLGGNGTRIDMNDNIGEMGLYAPRYFRVEAPGSNTLALADMQSTVWQQYGTFRILDTATSSIWFDTNTLSAITRIGDVQSAGNDTLFTANDASRVITGRAEDAFGGSYTFATNGVSQFAELTSNDGAGYTGLVRATATTSYIQSQDSNTGLINVWQTTASSAIGQSTDGVDSVTLNITPTNATITGLTNSSQFLFDDFNKQIIASIDDSFQVRDTFGSTWLSVNTASKFGILGDYTNAHAYISVDSISDVITLDSKDGTIVSGDTLNSNNFTKTILDDPNQKWTFATGGSDRFIAYKDWIFLGGAVVSGSIQSYTSTGSVTMNNNIATLQYNPASVNATATITLPATSGGTGSRVTIVFGGTITSGNPVVTALTIAPNTGNTIVDSNPPTTANAGDVLEYIKIGAYWYRAD